MTHFYNDIFSNLLCAFRKNYSCQSLLLKIIEDWKKALDNHETVGVIQMDLSKAFDSLPHDLLIQKCRAYSMSDTACDLLTGSGRWTTYFWVWFSKKSAFF